MLPSERIGQLARARLDKEKEKGAFFFPEGAHAEAIIEAILDYLDETY